MSDTMTSAHEHGDWDLGGYCNKLVLDDDGCGDVCGYRRPTLPVEVTVSSLGIAPADVFAEWTVARRELIEAALPVAHIAVTAYDAGRGVDSALSYDDQAVDRYRDAAARCRTALDRFHKLAGLGRPS